jgi:hypothetical protein
MPTNTKETAKLELDDYQPRGHDPLLRLTYDRAFPDGKVTPHMALSYPRALRENEPPMRDALGDLRTFLRDVHDDITERELHAVEATVTHLPHPMGAEGEGAGWAYTVNVLAVPRVVIEEQSRTFAAWLEQQTASAK